MLIEKNKQKLQLEKNNILKSFYETYIHDESGHKKPGFQTELFEENKDTEKYEGELKDVILFTFDKLSKGKKHGKGVEYYKSGDVYVGNFANDKFHGDGIYIFESGERFEGKLANGKKTGEGSYFYENGNSYIGGWKSNKKSGFGVYIYACK